jgi:UDP-glucose 4-epimerase
MEVIVTGGAGFVGTNLIKRLLKDGQVTNRIISIDNYSTGKKENEQEGCKYFDFDLSESNVPFDEMCTVERFEKPGIIFHVGAVARIQPSLKNPVFTINNNFNSTLNVLDWARRKNIPVVFAGSSSKHHGLWGSPYAWSKFGGEQLCELYNKVYGLPTSICRFYNVYGPHQLEGGTYATLVGIFEKLHREGKPLTITGTGEQRRDFTHVDDIVDGLIRCGNSLIDGDSGVSGEVFELGRGQNYSINEVANMFGEDYPKEYIPARKGEYDVTLADYSKAKEILGWEPSINLKDYLCNG